MLRATRFLRGYLRPRLHGIQRAEVSLSVDGSEVPATFICPDGGRPRPGWIVLHGITVPGRNHPGLRRFSNALAASGAAVLIPEVPAWRNLELDTTLGDRTIVAAASFLEGRSEVLDRRFNLVGFSFGATQALVSAGHPELRDRIRGVVGFGAYSDLRRTLHCMMTGEHEWRGRSYRIDPDPYGRWVVVANYLNRVPGFEQMHEVQAAARLMAAEAGRRGAYAADREYDAIKAELRRALPAEQRELWDLIAPPHDIRPSARKGRELAEKLFAATADVDTALDPGPRLAPLDQRIVLVHGRGDRLIPFTETLRLSESLPSRASVTTAITGLYAHSRSAERLGLLAYPREIARYVLLLNRALRPA